MDFRLKRVVVISWGLKSGLGCLKVDSVFRVEDTVVIELSTHGFSMDPMITYPAIAVLVPQSNLIKIVVSDKRKETGDPFGFTDTVGLGYELIVE